MALLEAREVSVRFGGHLAVNKVDLEVEAGRVTGLIGPNGAGKTTIFNALTGLQETSGGHVFIDGADVSGLAPHKRARKGMARTFQRLELFSLLTVRENVLVGAEVRKRWARDKAADPEAVVAEVLERIGLTDLADQRVDSLPTGKARLVELARALASQPRVLLLDEPSSGLNEAETHEMATVLRQVADEGLAVLLVEHDMSLVMGVCEQIFVLDFGQIIANGDPTEIQGNPVVQEAYLGAERETEAEERLAAVPPVALVTEPGPAVDEELPAIVPILEVVDLRAAYGDIDVLHGVDFAMAPGTVFALLGPNGAGKSTTLKVISGLMAPTGGSVALCGRRVTGADADALARAGVCLVPEGRGIFPNLTVTENLRMATYTGTSFDEILDRSFTRFPRLAERRTQVAGTMSGGEQQMLAMARALATDPAVLLLDELSMGLAPIIVSGLYEQVQAIAEEGTSILVVEQFAHEVLGVADVAAIMLHGRVQRTGTPAEISDELAAAYLGGAT